MKKLLLCLLLLTVSLGTGNVWAEPVGQAEHDLGDAWAELGNWQRAVTHYRRALRENPQLTSARLGLAESLGQMGQGKRALAELARLEKAAKASAVTACAVGALMLKIERPQEACRNYSLALSLQKKMPDALWGLGQCHQELFARGGRAQDKQKAIAHFQSLLAIQPSETWVRAGQRALDRLAWGEAGELLAQAQESFSTGDFVRAEKILRQLLLRQPEMKQAHYLLGLVLASPAFGQVRQAQAAWKKAGDLKEALLQRGISAYEEYRLDLAAHFMRRALALDPKYARAHYYLATVLREQMKPELAVVAYRRVVDLRPGSALAQRAAAKIQVLTGQVRSLLEDEVVDTGGEVQLGHRLSANLVKRFGLVEDLPLQQRLNRILKRLVQHCDRQPGSVPFRVRVLDVDGINALSFVGGTIYLFKGLVHSIQEKMGDSDDVFAAVIGHELAHVVMRHGLEQWRLSGGLAGIESDKAVPILGLNRLAERMSRAQEYEADQFGALFAYRAGFDPVAALRLQRQLSLWVKKPALGSDHPRHQERATSLQEYLIGLRTKARRFDNGLKALQGGDYQDAIMNFEIFLGVLPSSWEARNNLGVAMLRQAYRHQVSEKTYKLGLGVDLDSGARPIHFRSKGGPAGEFYYQSLVLEAKDLFTTIAAHRPGYGLAKQNLAASLLALGKAVDARRLLVQILDRSPASAPIRANLAVSFLLENKLDQGIAILQEIVNQTPQYADAYYNLALAFEQKGDATQARQNWLAYLSHDKKPSWARFATDNLRKLKENP